MWLGFGTFKTHLSETSSLATNGVRRARGSSCRTSLNELQDIFYEASSSSYCLGTPVVVALHLDMPSKSKSTSNPSSAPTRPVPPASSPPHSTASEPPPPEESAVAPNITSEDFKVDLLAALQEEMVGPFRTELETAMTNNLTQIKSELHAVKTELNANMVAIKSEVDVLKVSDMQGSLSTCTDYMVSLKSKVERL